MGLAYVIKDLSEGFLPEKKMEIAIEFPVEDVKEVVVKDEPVMIALRVQIPVEVLKEIIPKVKQKTTIPMTLEEKILNYINIHPMGTKVSEMEAPFGETRMKIGYIAKTLLEEGKIQKMDNIYFPLK